MLFSSNPVAATPALVAVATLAMQALFLNSRANGHGDPFSGRRFGGGLAADFPALCQSAAEMQRLVTATPGIPAGGTSDSGRAYSKKRTYREGDGTRLNYDQIRGKFKDKLTTGELKS